MADKEYIEREAAKQVLELYMTGLVNVTNVSENTKELYLLAKDHAKDYLSVVPAADVVEVRRGEWSVAIGYDPARRVMCDLCRRMNYEPTNFCPNCGADMRGEKDE